MQNRKKSLFHAFSEKNSINLSFLAHKPKIRVCKSCLVIKHTEETSAALSVTACWVEKAPSQTDFGTAEALPAQGTAATQAHLPEMKSAQPSADC